MGWKLLLPLLLLGVTVASVGAEQVHGTLVDSDGKPVAGASLSGLGVDQRQGGSRTALVRATTGANGEFTLERAVAMPSKEFPILLMARTKEGVFSLVTLTEENGKAAMAPPIRLKLRLVDSQDKPVPGAIFQLKGVNSGRNMTKQIQYMASWVGESEASKRVNEQGEGVVEGLPANAQANFLISAPGKAALSVALDLPEKGESSHLIVLQKSATLSGRVLQEGEPAEGITIVATSSTSGDHITTQTDANGRYELRGVPTGKVVLFANLGKLGKEWLANRYARLNLREGAELNGLNFTISKGIEVPGRVVAMDSGLPVANAEVDIIADESGQTLRTDAQGRFTARVLPGLVQVQVVRINNRRIGHPIGLSTTVDAGTVPPIELRVPDVYTLEPILRLKGIVKDKDGKPVAGATVKSLGTETTATTGEDGRFQFQSVTLPGNLVYAFKGDEVSLNGVELKGPSEIEVTIDGKAATIQGVLVDEAGKPMTGVEVTLDGILGRTPVAHQDATSDEKGAFRFEGVFPGVERYAIWAKKEGFGAETAQDIRLKPGETKSFPMKMVLADCVIEGQVLESDGKPAKGALVSSQLAYVDVATADDDGKFRLTKVPRGEHYIVAGRGISFEAPTLAKTGDKNVVIKLSPATKTIPGVVTQDRTGMKALGLDVAEWVSGGGVSLESLKGKYVVLDFWAVWCGPCVEGLPRVQALSSKYKDLVAIGIHAPGTPRDQVAAFLKSKGITYQNAIDADEDLKVGKTARAYGPTGIPHMFLIDPSGRIVVDTNDVEEIEKALEKVLKT